MEVARAVGLCSLGWALNACVTEGRVLWHEVADVSSDANTTTTSGDPTSEATTGEPATTADGEPATTTSASGEVEESTGDGATTSSEAPGTEESSAEGSSGAAACIALQASAANLLVDNLEDGDTVLPTEDGRRGWWWSQTDGTSGLRIPADPWTPTNGDAVSGEFAAYVSGEGFGGWGVQLGVTLNEECSYDASAFSGVEFWARGTGTVRIRFTTLSTVPADHLPPGTCTDLCWDDFGTDVELTESWTRYTVTWGQLQQQGWGESAEFDPIELVGFNWQGGGQMSTFDLWLDDIRFAPSI